MPSRRFVSTGLTIASSSDVSNRMAIGGMAFGLLHMPAALTGTEYTIEAYNEQSETWARVKDSTGTDIAAIPHTNSAAVRLPDEVFAANFIRFKSNATEAADRLLVVDLKS